MDEVHDTDICGDLTRKFCKGHNSLSVIRKGCDKLYAEGKYDLWTVRLLLIILCIPPMCQSDLQNATSPDWLSLPIKMPRNGVHAILDTGEYSSHYPHLRHIGMFP